MTERTSREIPQQFRDIARRMHQDLDRILPSETSDIALADYLVRGTTEVQRQVAAKFVRTLLSSNLSDRELASIWANAGSDWHVAAADIRVFLEQLRDTLTITG